MRISSLGTMSLILIVILFFERQTMMIPVAWMVLGLMIIRSHFPLLLTIALSVLSDVFLALPFGTTAIIVALVLFFMEYLPKKQLLSLLFLAVIGMILGFFYGWLSQRISLEWIVVSGVVSVILYTIGSKNPAIEEIGNA